MSDLQVYNLFRDKKTFKNGLFITLEGVDGAGKGTQTRMLTEYLEALGYKVKNFAFPQYQSPIGKVISSYLTGEFGPIDQVSGELVSIAYAADRASVTNEIKALLNAGYIVISDRYTYSNVFSGAKLKPEKWMDFVSWIEDIEFNQLGVVKPNFNFYLYVEPEVSLQRTEKRGKRDYQDGKADIHENNGNLLSNAAKLYLEIAKNRDNWFVINQMNSGKQISKNETFELIKEKIDLILK